MQAFLFLLSYRRCANKLKYYIIYVLILFIQSALAYQTLVSINGYGDLIRQNLVGYKIIAKTIC